MSEAARAPRRFAAHETARERALEGRELAGFRARAIAFGVDFLLSGVAFMGIVLPLGVLAAKLGWIKHDVKLEFDFHHWYALPFLVAYFGLLAWFGDGRTPGKRLTRIRVVSLTHERLTLWQAIESGVKPTKQFMLHYAREKDLALFVNDNARAGVGRDGSRGQFEADDDQDRNWYWAVHPHVSPRFISE